MKKLVFFGTPDYVILVLEALKRAGYQIAAVVTQPAKPIGRKQVITTSPAAQWAKKEKIQIIDDRPQNVIEQLKKLNAPLAVLAAYGRIIPQEIIDVFPFGILNIHPSLLPKYRGASPIEAAIVAGEQQTGVTIIKLDQELDHGPIVAQFTEDALPIDTKTTLRERLFKKGAETLVSILPAYLEGHVTPREQDHEKATFTTLIKREFGYIPPHYLKAALEGKTVGEKWEITFIKDFTLRPTPSAISQFIRAMSHWPSAWTEVKLLSDEVTKLLRIKILKAHTEKLRTTNYELRTILIPDLVQLEGKNPVSWQQFRKGYPEARF